MGAAVVLLTAACGAGTPEVDATSAPSGSTGAGRVDDAVLGAPTDEGEDVTLPVAVEVADGAAVTALVTPDAGAVLETTAADGTRYRLAVPAGAVAVDTVVTMTPLAAVTGDMVDGMVGGVDLAPDGLQLGRAATLTIEPSREVPVEHQVPFGYQGAGTEMMLAPMDPDPGRIAVWVEHFSGYGVLESTDARMEMNRRLAAVEATRASTYHQRIAHVFAEARVDALTGAGLEGLDARRHAEIRALQEAYLDEHLRPRLEYAERLSTSGNPGDLEYVADVIGEVLALERTTELMGTDSLLPQDVFAVLDLLLSNVRDGMGARCAEENDFTVLPILLSIERTLQLLGIGDDDDGGGTGCFGFELRFSSELQVLGPWPDLAGAVDVTVPVDVLGLAEGPAGTAPLDWRWTGLDTSCPVQARQAQGGDLTVMSISFELPQGDAAYRADGRLVPPEDVVMVYDVGDAVTEVLWEDCQQTHGFWSGDYVRDAWTALHHEEAVGPWWQADGWEMLFDGPLVARKVHEQRREDLEICFEEIAACWPLPVPVVETTTLELMHAPS